MVMQVSVTLQLLQAAFSYIPVLTRLLLISHAELQQETDVGLAAVFNKVMHSSSSGLWLYECNRKTVMPTLQVSKLLKQPPQPGDVTGRLHMSEWWCTAGDCLCLVGSVSPPIN